MKTGWNKVRLGEICEFRYGKSLKDSNRSGAGFPVYGSNGVVGRHSQALTTGRTIVIGRKGSYGEVNVSAGPCWPIDTTYFVDATCTETDLAWLGYRLASLGLNTMNRAAAVPGLNREDAYRQELLLPPIEEQRRIAAILDKSAELRAKRRASLAHLDSLTQSIFLDMFGDPGSTNVRWPTSDLGTLVNSIDSGASPVCLSRPATGDEWGVLKLGAVTWCEYDDSENKALPSEIPPLPRNEVNVGDVLFVRKNTLEHVGATAYVEHTRPRLLLSDLIFRLRLRPDVAVKPRYLQQLLVTPAKREQVRRFAGGSAGSMPNISKARLAKVKIEMPPLELQREFDRRVVSVRSALDSAREEAAVLDELFASLQHRAFSGAL